MLQRSGLTGCNVVITSWLSKYLSVSVVSVVLVVLVGTCALILYNRLGGG